MMPPVFAADSARKGGIDPVVPPDGGLTAERWLSAPATLPKKWAFRHVADWLDRHRPVINTSQKLRECAGAEEAHGRAFLFVPVALGAGAATWFSLPRDPPVQAIGFCVLVAVIIAHLVRRGDPRIRYGILATIFFLAGMLASQLEAWRKATVILDSAVTTRMEGIVERREADANGNWRYLICLEETKDPELRRPPKRVSVLALSEHTPVGVGDIISGLARLAPPSGPVLAGLNDFAFSSYFDGIGAVGYFYGPPEGMSPAGDKHSARRFDWLDVTGRQIFALRSAIGDRIRATLPGDTGAFAAAIVTDERRAISKDMIAALRLSGLAHIVAISGLNMALAAGIFFIGLRSAFSLLPDLSQAHAIKKFAAFGALVTVTAYFLISGFAVSAERAYLMVVIMLVAVFFDRPSISLRNVALSAIVILLLSPSEVMGPSFQMSFAATLALVSGYSVWKESPAPRTKLFGAAWFVPVRAVWRLAAGIFLTSLIGGLSTAMFSVEHFHHLTTYGLVANLAAMPIISLVVMPFALLAMLLMPLGLDWLALAVMGFGIDIVLNVAVVVSGWGGEVVIGRLHPLFLPLAITGFLLLTLLRTKLRLLGIVPYVAGVLLASVAAPYEKPDLLIAEDGRLVALARPDGLSSNRRRPPDFIFSQWQRALELEEHVGPHIKRSDAIANRTVVDSEANAPVKRDGAEDRGTLRAALATEEVDRFNCLDRAWCVARTRAGVAIATIEDPTWIGAACDVADLVISARHVHFEQCRSGARLISPTLLRQTGALEIRFGESASDPLHVLAAGQGADRPWTRHRSYDWRTGTHERRSVEELLEPLSDSGG
ncbi:competence protein ComEC family protein [Rhizobiaceae bacterium n13]|uniref:Competence protein ComEC family protein n=1 Tax=Ferirhizobium litorale TaxID=2927786 RepID=A0AAE3QIC3_9HYPH|nr:ComEC/Rec2 family competence protein [Fererhizobium litorale]MDI7864022.1 competence protein ComEC family protein [Fererhizobium litorale]MDI7924495.1 competence protein ComEC family protein [Fererhizobium litorale]